MTFYKMDVDELKHHYKGEHNQKDHGNWADGARSIKPKIRRYQNEDGTLNSKGEKRYAIGEKRLQKRLDYVAKKNDLAEASSRAGTLGNINAAAEAGERVTRQRQINETFGSNKEYMLDFANKTVDRRVAAGIGGGVLTSAAIVAALSQPVFAIPAAAIATGTAFVEHLLSR